MSREGKLAKNTMVLSIGTFLPKLAAFITLPILTAYLTKEELGTYDLVTVLVSFILPVATLQIQTAAFRYLIDVRENKQKSKEIITNIFVFILPISIVALVFFAFLLPGNYTVRLLICGYYFVDILVNSARQVARGLNDNKSYSISAIASAVGKMIFAIVFVLWLKRGLTGALLSLLLASFMSLLIIIIRIHLFSYIDISTINSSVVKELIRYSWPMIPNSMSMTVMRVSDRFVVTMFMGLSANAVYAVANKIPSLLTLAQTTFTMAWQESASMAKKDKDSDIYYSQMFHKMYNFMAGIMGLLICLTPLLFRILIKGDYEDAYCHMPILLLAMFFYSQCAYLGGIYLAYKKTKNVGITTMVAALCNLVVDLTLIHFIGLFAASGSTLISYLLLFIFRSIDVKKFANIQYNVKHEIFVILILIIQSVLCIQRNIYCDSINIFIGVLVFWLLNQELVKIFISKVFHKIRIM